jgi:TPR repeat protein
LINIVLFSSHLAAATAQCKKDFTGELKEICIKAIKDDPEAQLQISRYYAGQVDPSVVNYPQAFYWHRRLARLAVHLKLEDPVYSETMYNTGVFYAEGLGVKQDYKKALYWFKKAADRGDDIAMFRLAIIYSDGLGIKSNLKESLDWLKRAVVAGNLDAKVLLAQVYSEGQLVSQNNVLAIKLLREAVEKNSASASFALGNFYLHGIDVEKSRVMAKNLFSTACRANLLEACRAYYDLDIQENTSPARLNPSTPPIE